MSEGRAIKTVLVLFLKAEVRTVSLSFSTYKYKYLSPKIKWKVWKQAYQTGSSPSLYLWSRQHAGPFLPAIGFMICAVVMREVWREVVNRFANLENR